MQEITVKQIADLAGCSTRTVHYALRAGKIEGAVEAKIRPKLSVWHIPADAGTTWAQEYVRYAALKEPRKKCPNDCGILASGEDGKRYCDVCGYQEVA